MEALLHSSAASITISPAITPTTFPPSFTIPHTHFHPQTPSVLLTFPSSISTTFRAAAHLIANSSNSPFPQTTTPTHTSNRQWMVRMETPPQELTTKPQIIDYYVRTLQQVLGSEKDAQMCIYNASWDINFGFCCDIDEDTACKLAVIPGVLSVKPDTDFNSDQKDYSRSKIAFNHQSDQLLSNTLLFPAGNLKHWVVRMERPAIGVMRKGPVVDYYVRVLMKVLGNEKDAQMCIYHISWESNYGFCCELDDDCARELADVPGVLSVWPDENFGSDAKDYAGVNLQQSRASENSSALSSNGNIKTKKLFITGLSFYTSEKTLRAAFEGFGELVEVKIIMDKISKRSKGYGFVEYTTEEAAGTALREMNGKIINGWMITVDVAKKNPQKYNRG